MSRVRVLGLLAVLVTAAAAVLLLSGGNDSKRTARACPAGQLRVSDRGESASSVLIGGKASGGGEAERERELAREKAKRGESGDYESHFRGKCAPVAHPESSRDLAKFNEFAGNRQGSDSPGEFAKALKQRDRLAAHAAAANVPGTGGTWTPYGKGPLIGDDPTYPTTLGDGFGKINGRVSDFAYVNSSKKLYAAVAQGGVWESDDLGDNWKSIGDNLPIQSTGALGYTSAGGGTLIVATGDHAFSNDYAGVGAFWTTDDGKTWHRSKGSPVGALSFRVAVDPNNPDVVYLATGQGLFRSTDAGRNFANVNLPTGDCAGDSGKPNCFFANVVTDVAVQPKDKLGHDGGAVIAAVGWRAGQFPNFNGKPQAPANGLYRSDNGTAGSFTKVPDSAGFTPTDHAGRTEFGVTTGPDQNSNYLYAIAQDTQLFVEQSGGENDVALGVPGTPSVLDAIYVSPDFGKSWTVMESRNEFFNPGNGSTLSQLTALGIGPGYQVTYNQWIKPDPSRTAPDGTPARVLLGMEEVWQTNSTQLIPQSGHSQFQVIGSYTANGGACLVVPEQCGAKQAVAGYTTTHPDQHGATLIPDASGGGVTLIVGNDGGVYKQHADSGQDFDQMRWGTGANNGFNTLLPYGVAMARDGTVYGGLQDNGQLKILPNGEQHTVYVGDGIFALVDPENSKIAYDELPNAGINVSTDGGTTWASIDPQLEDPDFVAPMVMDAGKANHILAGGREIAETTAGPDTTTCKNPDSTDPTSCSPSDTDWKYVFNLGTMKHPGDPDAQASSQPARADGTNSEDAPNHASSAALNGANAYVGFCGDCDPVKRHRVFHNGFATNVGGSKPPQIGSGDGWHITEAKGLPNRIITGVVPDPSDPKTVYVTLGASAARYFAPLGSLGEDATSSGGGHVYKTTDAGKTFKNISGNLPNVQATWPLVRNGQLIVATAVGVFASKGKNGGSYSPLGDNLPSVAVYQISLKPGDPDTLVAATFGRGVYTYKFANRTGTGCVDKIRPKTRIAKAAIAAARRGSGSRKLRLRGTVTDRTSCKGKKGKVKRTVISIARQIGRTGRGGRACRNMKANGRFAKAGSCHKFVYLTARHKGKKWSFTTKRRVPPGYYRIRVKSYDAAGNRERPGKKTNTVRLLLR